MVAVTHRNMLEEAVLSFRAASKLVEADPIAFFRLGNTLFALNRYPEAESAFQKALQVSL